MNPGSANTVIHINLKESVGVESDVLAKTIIDNYKFTVL